MMTTSGVSGSNNAAGALTGPASGGLSGVDFNTFLKLLVAQLKNQDPLNPLDGTQFTGQIAQFSALEQQINTNNYLSSILEQRDYGQMTLANSYLGKVVLAPGDTLAVGETGGAEFGYKLDGTASSVNIEIYDAAGKVVRSQAGEGATGNHIVTWDGKSDLGEQVAAGQYTVRVKALDADGKVMTNSVMTYGRVASALNDNGSASLILADGRTAELDQILAVTSM
ncbi:MAG: flagellar hook assembly protein FlgD [Alphaproteobacteria bacterium]|nr:MAG: flagellar hook assembly protein FlgD [Alphaproteobacteria bacterium]